MGGPLDVPLRDIHLPAPVSWWPPAPGWWLLLLIAVVLTLGCIFWQRHRAALRRRPLYLARRELEILGASIGTTDNPQKLARDLSALLRRVSVAVFPRSEVASLTGDAWPRFLDEAAQQPLFMKGPGRCLVEAPYRPDAKLDSNAALDLCERWLVAVQSQRTGRRG